MQVFDGDAVCVTMIVVMGTGVCDIPHCSFSEELKHIKLIARMCAIMVMQECMLVWMHQSSQCVMVIIQECVMVTMQEGVMVMHECMMVVRRECV
jgi:hypothetical protein